MTPKLEAAYAQPHRRYHTRRHIEACLALLDGFQLSDDDRRLLTWALWWHDAVYDPKAPDNEEQSARMALTDLPAFGASDAEAVEVARLIRLTAGHQVPADDRLGAILVSIDLAILGGDPAAYDEYVAQVREEYAHVPEALWRQGRARVMQKFLDAPVLYAEASLRAQLEGQARSNIAREIAKLQSPAQ